MGRSITDRNWERFSISDPGFINLYCPARDVGRKVYRRFLETGTHAADGYMRTSTSSAEPGPSSSKILRFQAVLPKSDRWSFVNDTYWEGFDAIWATRLAFGFTREPRRLSVGRRRSKSEI